MENNEERSLETQVVTTDMNLDETQMAAQLYNNAGLDPIVDAGLKDYDAILRKEDKFIKKVMGPRDSDIKGYGQAVAKRVSIAVFNLLNKQYGGKVGDLRAYIYNLEDERDRANARYDDLMGRVVGILGEEYKELRTDSNQFMQKLADALGEDLKESKIDKKALAESLADIDGLRSRIKDLEKEKQEAKESYEARISELDSKINDLESDKTALTGDLNKANEDYERLSTAAETLNEDVSSEAIGNQLGTGLYTYLVQDTRVPKMFINGMNKFIDFEKYLGTAASKGAEEAIIQAQEKLKEASAE
jgi:chromosome segregation ATPase